MKVVTTVNEIKITSEMKLIIMKNPFQ